MSDKYLWVESYRPHTVEDCILPDRIKSIFQSYREEKEFPNLILAGPAGVGKTSLARALCNEVDADLLFVNASLDRGIGEIRTTVAQFASCSSMFGGVKVVLLDEADNLTQDSQKALRALIEEFQNHCRFILTCNYPHNIIDAIHSRCSAVDFNIRSPKDIKKLIGEFAPRVVGILRENDIKFSPQVLQTFMFEYAPDWRHLLNQLQFATKTGELNGDSLSQTATQCVEYMSKKQFTNVRDWVFGQSHVHPRVIERNLYKALEENLVDASKPQAVLIFAEYSDKITRGADPSITLLALATQLMMELQWK